MTGCGGPSCGSASVLALTGKSIAALLARRPCSDSPAACRHRPGRDDERLRQERLEHEDEHDDEDDRLDHLAKVVLGLFLAFARLRLSTCGTPWARAAGFKLIWVDGILIPVVRGGGVGVGGPAETFSSAMHHLRPRRSRRTRAGSGTSKSPRAPAGEMHQEDPPHKPLRLHAPLIGPVAAVFGVGTVVPQDKVLLRS